MAGRTRTESLRLTINGQEVVNSQKDLQKALRESRKELSGLEEGTEAWIKQSQNINQIEERLDEVKKSNKEVGKSFKEQSAAIKEGQVQLENSIPIYGQAKSGIVGMTRAAMAFIATPLGAVIGALVVVFSALKAAFTDSEEGQNKFNKYMSVINVVLGNFRDLLADAGEAIIWMFENPQEAMEKFGNFFRDQITVRFNGFLNLIPNLAKAVDELFKGNFSEAGKIAADAVGQVTLGVESVTDSFNDAADAVTNFIDETIKESEQGMRVAEMRAKADKIDRQLLVERAKIESEIAGLRLKSRQEDEYGADVRKQALLDAQKLEEDLLAREKEALQLRADAVSLENTFSRSTKENLDAEAQAIAAVARVEANRLNQQRQTQRELNRLNKEIERDSKAKQKEAINELNEANKRELISLTEKRSKELISQEEFNKQKEELELAHLLALIALKQELGEETIDLEQKLAEKELDILNKRLEKQKEADEKEAKLKAEQLKLKQESAKAFGEEAAAAIENAKTIEEAATGLLNVIKKEIGALIARAVANAITNSFIGTPPLAAVALAPIAGAAAKALFNNLVPSFYYGGDTGSANMGGGDRYGAYAGYVHQNEYVVPASMRSDPYVADLERVIESRRPFSSPSGGGTTNVNTSVDFPGATNVEKAAAMLMQVANVLATADRRPLIGDREIRKLYTEGKKDYDKKEQTRAKGSLRQ